MITTTFRTKEIPACGDPGRHTLYTYMSAIVGSVRFPPPVQAIVNAPAWHAGKKIIDGDANPLIPAG